MQVNQGDSQPLRVGSQIGNLTLDPSFGHNLCFKYPNGSWEPILHIYVPKKFQPYNEFFNSMIFDPCNCPLKIQESIGNLIPRVGIHLRVWGVHSLTLSYIPKSMKCDSRASFLARTFVSHCLDCEPKVKFATISG